MSIELIVNPMVNGMSWNDFCTTSQMYSVALDGYVSAGPCFDETKVLVNFNHHEFVDRLATRATCAQVLMAIRQGMFTKFRDEFGPKATVYVNDPDEDVCTAWFLLHNYHMVIGTMNPMINKLVSMEDALDATAGAYPFPADLPSLKELAWVFEPYRHFRLNGGLDKRDAASFRSIIYDVEHRIMQHVTGHGSSIPLDMRYNVIGGGKGWIMVEEIGAHARTGMFGNGVQAYVSVRKRPDGKWIYTIGKLSSFIPFNLIKLTELLNEEDKSVCLTDRWGGGNNIMGSPRTNGSSLDPDTLSKLIKELHDR
jgi:hypothetical protein